MNNKHVFLVVVVVAFLAVVLALLAATAGARTPSTALKTRVLDKSAADKWIEVRVLEQTKGKTNLLGDKFIVRVLSTTKTYNKSNAAQASTSWLSRVQADDLVSVLGEYKSTDGTLWADRLVNRSR